MERNIQYNKELIERYPFLMPRNLWTGEVSDEYDYTYTKLDAMPNGWRIAFGEQMCEEIREELIKADYLDRYRIMDIKEKWGRLAWYDNYGTDRLYREIIPKYERLSEHTCIRCGRPATKVSTAWISPWCDGCAKKISKYERFMDIDEFYSKGDDNED